LVDTVAPFEKRREMIFHPLSQRGSPRSGGGIHRAIAIGRLAQPNNNQSNRSTEDQQEFRQSPESCQSCPLLFSDTWIPLRSIRATRYSSSIYLLPSSFSPENSSSFTRGFGRGGMAPPLRRASRSW